MLVNWMRSPTQGPQAVPPMIKEAQQWQKQALVNPSGEPLLFSRPIARDSFLGATVLPLYHEVSGAYTKVWKEATTLGKGGNDPLGFASTKIFNEQAKHLQDDSTTVWGWIEKAVKAIVDFLDGVKDAAFSVAKWIGGALNELFTGDIKGLANRFEDLADRIGSAVKGLLEFGAGVLDGLTFGLSTRVLKFFGVDNVLDFNSAAFQAGAFVGTIAQTVLMAALPGGALGIALRLTMAAGAVANAAEAYQNGDTLGVVFNLAAAVTGAFAGRSACQVGRSFGRWGSLISTRAGGIAASVGRNLVRGAYWIGTANGVYNTVDAIREGDWKRVGIGLAQTAVGRYMSRRACFREGSPILRNKRRDSTPIEKLWIGDWVLSLDENNPLGEPTLKRITRFFIRQANVLNLHARNQIIGTTEEHPFFVVRCWDFIPASELQVGDVFLSDDKQWVVLEDICNTGVTKTVYNFEVEDFHTYFVGGKEWGFSVWAHNAAADYTNARNAGRASRAEAAELNGMSIADWCRFNRHRPIAEQHRTLWQKLRGHFAYYGITGNGEALRRFRDAVNGCRAVRGALCFRGTASTFSWGATRRYPLPAATRSTVKLQDPDLTSRMP